MTNESFLFFSSFSITQRKLTGATSSFIHLPTHTQSFIGVQKRVSVGCRNFEFQWGEKL